MGLLDDTAIFAAVIQRGGFSHAAKHLGLSNGLVSRRIAQLEAELGVSLIKRTTRQFQLTPEGELFWNHAQRIQQELHSARSLIQSLAEKPTGEIRITAPVFFGRKFLMPIITKFMHNFCGIHVELLLSDQQLDIIRENFDLSIRGSGYLDNMMLKDSSLKMKLLLKQKVGLYASRDYLAKYGEPLSHHDLHTHKIIDLVDKSYHPAHVVWRYTQEDIAGDVALPPVFRCNDTDSRIAACVAGHGIGRFSELSISSELQQQLRSVLTQYDWGTFNLYAIYAQQQALPKRTRLLLDFIAAHIQGLIK